MRPLLPLYLVSLIKICENYYSHSLLNVFRFIDDGRMDGRTDGWMDGLIKNNVSCIEKVC